MRAPSRQLLALLCLAQLPLFAADLITNGGFESGFTGWTRVDQTGSDGTFHLQSGALSPWNSFTVPPPPEGAAAAMTDQFGPGAHVLYQDFLVDPAAGATLLEFSLYIQNLAEDFFVPSTLDFSMELNQQARVDLMLPSVDPFSLAGSDIVATFFQTAPGDSLTSGYTHHTFDIAGLLQTYAGQTLRLRFAESDNVERFNFGVDNVAIRSPDATVPDSALGILPAMTLLGAMFAGRRWSVLKARR